MQVFIIPAWLSRKLKANNMALTVVSDIERLSSILTKEDLFFLLKANQEATETGAGLDFPLIKMEFPVDRWIENLLDVFGPNELEMLQAEFNLTQSGLPRDLLVYGNVLEQESVENRKFNLHNYETVMLQPEVAAVVVNPVTEDGNVHSLQNFLDVLQKQIGFEKVAELNLFKRFVKKV